MFNDGPLDRILDWLPVLVVVITVLGMIGLPFVCFYSAVVEVRMVNQNYGTKYTALEYIMAKGTILNYLQEGRRQTVNVKLK